jgi:hypothetical protein
LNFALDRKEMANWLFNQLGLLCVKVAKHLLLCRLKSGVSPTAIAVVVLMKVVVEYASCSNANT